MKNLKVLWLMGLAFAAMASVPGAHADQASFKAAMQTCSEKLDLTLPIKPHSLDERQRGDLHACLKAEGVERPRHHPGASKEVRACAAAQGVTLPDHTAGEPHAKLTDAQRAIVHACFKQAKAAAGP